MSLLNQVLHDLERRRAETAGAAALPRHVRPLPAVDSSHRTLVLAGLGLLCLALAGIAGWMWLGPDGVPMPAAAGANAPPPAPLAVVPPVAPAPLPGALRTPSDAEKTAASAVAAAPANGGRLAEAGPAPAASVAAGAAPALPDRLERPPALRLERQLSSLPSATTGRTPSPPPTAGAPTLPSLPEASNAAAALPVEAAATGAIEKSPVDESPRAKADRLYRSALGLINQGRNDDGAAALRAALREDGSHVPARQILLKLYLDNRSWEAAQGVLREGLERLPQQSPWAILLARLLAERGDNAGALQVLEKYAAGGEASADYQGALGAFLQRLNRDAEAELRYERATRIEAANGRWWIGLGIARESQGKAAEARLAFQRALETRALAPDLQAYAEGRLK